MNCGATMYRMFEGEWRPKRSTPAFESNQAFDVLPEKINSGGGLRGSSRKRPDQGDSCFAFQSGSFRVIREIRPRSCRTSQESVGSPAFLRPASRLPHPHPLVHVVRGMLITPDARRIAARHHVRVHHPPENVLVKGATHRVARRLRRDRALRAEHRLPVATLQPPLALALFPRILTGSHIVLIRWGPVHLVAGYVCGEVCP